MNIPVKTTPYYEERRQTIHRHHYRNYSHSLRHHRPPELIDSPDRPHSLTSRHLPPHRDGLTKFVNE